MREAKKKRDPLTKISVSEKSAGKMINVTLEDGKRKEVIQVVRGMALEKFFQKYCPRTDKGPVVAGNIDYVFHDLWATLEKDCLVHPVDLSQHSGVKLYEHSIILLFLRAVHELFPQYTVEVSYHISRGIYCGLHGGLTLKRGMVLQLEDYMRKLVEHDEPFIREVLPYAEALRLLQSKNMTSQIKLLKNWRGEKVTFYHFGESISTCYGSTVPRSSYLKKFQLVFYPPGVIVRFPDTESPDQVPEYQEQSCLFRAFQEEQRLAETIEVRDIGDLHEMIRQQKIAEVIQMCEAIHEEKIGRITENICSLPNVRLILIAGPSSSGKTTFAKRLALHLHVHGVKTVAISLDDYFKNRADMPKDPDGKYDFEHIDAIDVPLLNEHLSQLLDGNEINLPKFNFVTGVRGHGKSLHLEHNELLILEGIHGLNDLLTPFIPRLQKFKIYVSALPVLKLDTHNRLSTSDLRLMRRMVRDYRSRGNNPLDTLRMWPSVRRGEIRFILPHQDNANVFFSSAMLYELGVLKPYVEPLLDQVPENVHEHSFAMRLREALSYCQEIPSEYIPPMSILREFIGNSCFEY